MTPINPKDNEKDGQDLTAEQVAHPLNVSPRAVRMWADDGKLPAELWYKLPGDRHYRFKPQIIAWLRDRKAA